MGEMREQKLDDIEAAAAAATADVKGSDGVPFGFTGDQHFHCFSVKFVISFFYLVLCNHSGKWEIEREVCLILFSLLLCSRDRVR